MCRCIQDDGVDRLSRRVCKWSLLRASDGWYRPEWIYGDQAADDRQLREPVGDGDHHPIVDAREGRQSPRCLAGFLQRGLSDQERYAHDVPFAGRVPTSTANRLAGGSQFDRGIHGRIDGSDMIDVLTPGDIAFNPLGSCQAPCDPAQFVAAFYRPDAPWSGINRGGGVRFHFSKVSPYLGALCRSK